MRLRLYETLRKPAHWGPLALAVVGFVWLTSGGMDAHRKDQKLAEAQLEAAWRAGQVESPRTLIVDFADDVTAEELASNGLEEIPVSAYSAVDRLYRVPFESEAALEAALVRLREDPRVQSVDFDVTATLPPHDFVAMGPPGLAACGEKRIGDNRPSFPDDPCFNYQWHLQQIGMPDAWKRSQGEGVVVAVIDTGVSRVGDLAGTPFVPGYNFVDNKEDASDDHGHGTHVAGTIAQSTHNGLGVSGVAFKASIMPLKVLSARGSGSMAAIAQAIRWAADHGAHVINMSLGGPFPVGTIHNAVKYARAKGVVVVAAAGNDGRGRVSYPGHYADVFAVAATQFDENTTFYSNWGKTIDIAAPGGNVRVDQNGDGQPDGVLQHTVVPGQVHRQDYLWFMGTSMASPHVAGVAALLVGAGVTKPDAVEALMMATARVPKSQAKDAGAAEGKRINDHYGAGIVDAGAALERAHATRGGGALALAAALAFGVTTSLRRRKKLGSLAPGRFAVGLLLGSSGLFFLPWALGLLGLSTPTALAPVSSGLPLGLSSWLVNLLGASAHGSPLLLSALLPLAAIAVGYGIKACRPALAGFALGVAGLLVALGLGGFVDVRWIPNGLDQIFLLVNAALATLLAALTLLKD